MSDVSFDADNKSDLHARTLTALIRKLELGPTILCGGSAGARVSMLAAAHDPEIVAGLGLWWISGGAIGLINLGGYYAGMPGILAVTRGMEAVFEAPSWAEQVERNPKARSALLAQEPRKFFEKMQLWASFFTPSDTSPAPGLAAADFARLRMPVLIFRSGPDDWAHTRRTSEWTHELIPHSKLIEPPWPEDEWTQRSATHGQPGRHMFENWPALAPSLLAHIAVAAR